MSIINTDAGGQASARRILAMIEADPVGEQTRLDMTSPGTTIAEARYLANRVLDLGRAGYTAAVLRRGCSRCEICELEARIGFTSSTINAGQCSCRMRGAGDQQSDFSGARMQGQIRGAFSGNAAGRAEYRFAYSSMAGQQHSFGNGARGAEQHGFGNGSMGGEQHGFGGSVPEDADRVATQGGLGEEITGFRVTSQSTTTRMPGMFPQGSQRGMRGVAEGFGEDSYGGTGEFSAGLGQSSRGGLGGTTDEYASRGSIGGNGGGALGEFGGETGNFAGRSMKSDFG